MNNIEHNIAIKMDNINIKTLAEHIDQMPMFPYFTLSHVLVCAMNARIDLGAGELLRRTKLLSNKHTILTILPMTGSLYFSRRHPLACYISTLLSIFSATILTNFLLNEPVISALGNTQQVLWATAIWYAIFYSPFDIVYRLCNFMPIKIGLHLMFEINNCKAIYQGILHASKVFPDSYVVMAIIGIVKGNGPGFTRLFERLIRGAWSLNVLEFMNPSYTTKISTFATLVFIANRHIEWLMISQSFVFFCVASACAYFRLSAILLDIQDPFSPLENLICLLVFGGIWDALARAISIDDRQSRTTNNNLRARAMKVDILTRDVNTVLVAEKPQLAQSAQVT